MRIQGLGMAWGLMLGSVGLLGCALPGIHRDSERRRSDAGGDTETKTKNDPDRAQVDAGDAGDVGSDAAADAGDGGDAGSDAGVPLDPMMDPKNRNEDFITFQSLVPRDHVFPEWPMPDSSPGAFVKPSYSATDRVVTDDVTKLRWQRVLPEVYEGCLARYPLRSVLQGVGTGCTWEEAKAYCRRPELEEELGPGNWRLPTKIELESIADVNLMPALDPVFETYPTDFFWTASPYPNPDGLKLAWAVDFSEGYTYNSGRYKGGRVRCVSSPEETGGRQPELSTEPNIVRDGKTSLVWQKASDSEARTWNQALEYCEKLTVEDGGWRLPFLKELLTIVDSTRHLPAIPPRAFPFTPNARFWTASKYADGEGQAFQVDFGKGAVNYSSIDEEHFVRCVR